jgi:putative peptidoglycan lipid II flippase
VASDSATGSSLRSVALLTGLSLVQLLVQFATQLVLARFFGAASEMDALVAALAVPVVIAAIVAGSLGYVMVPVYAEQVAAGRQREAALFVGQIGFYVLALSTLVAIGVAALAQPLAAMLFPGFSQSQLSLTASLLRVLSLLIVGNSLIAFLNAYYHCQRRFVWPAAAGVIGTLVTLACIVALHKGQGIDAVAWGLVVGAAVTAALLMPRFVEQAWQSLSLLVAPQPATRRAMVLLMPLVLGAIYWRLDPLVDRWLGSYLSAGSIAHLGYAWRLASALMMIGTSGLSIVAFPAIAAHAAAGQRTELNAEIAHALRLLAFLLVPMVVGLAFFAEPVVRLLFERGRFTAADTQAVATLLVLYLGVVVGGSVSDVLSRTLYAMHDTRLPVVVNTIVFTLAVGLKFLLVGQIAAAGLAAATSAYHLLNAAVLAMILQRRLGRDMLAGVGPSLVRCAASALVACLVAWLIGRSWTPFAATPAAISGALSYALLAWLLGDEFAGKLQGFLRGMR